MIALEPLAEVEPPPAPHAVVMYDDGAFPVEAVAAFLATGLLRGEAVLVLASGENHPMLLAAIRRRLGGTTAPGSPDGLVLLDAQAVLSSFLVDGRPDEALFNEVVGGMVAKLGEGGHRPLRAYGEMVALLCQQRRHAAALELELMWNDLAKRHSFSLMCGYGWKLFGASEHSAVFRHICDLHGRILLPLAGPEDAGRLAEGTLVGAELHQRSLAVDDERLRRQDAEAARQQRERELADFVDNAAEGLHKVSGDGIVLWANRAELELLGYEGSEYIGHHIAEFHVDRPVIESMLARLQAGEVLRHEPARMRCRDGSIKHVLVNSNAFFEAGKLVYTRCFTRDATPAVERERLLKELAEANRAKDEFLAMLGHELRNPLSPIVTALALMRAKGETTTHREQDIIQRQVDHLVKLLDDLSDVTRITRSHIPLDKRWLSLDEVVDRAVEMVSPQVRARGQRLQLDVPPGLRLFADELRLAQVVCNLLNNATKYTPEGGHVQVSARADGANLLLSVRDDGRGLSAEECGQVFELFYQARQPMHRPEGGLGVGLALVRALVRQHGGEVSAYSEGPGRGSEFRVRLPVGGDAMPEENAAPPALAAGRARGSSSRLFRIAVVDDNADAAESLAELLRDDGHQVQTHPAPQALLAALDEFRPDIVFLDIGMPGMDGYELARAIRSREVGRNCLLVALTGYGQAGDRAKSAQARIDHHLVKPAGPEEILTLIDACPLSGHPAG